MSRGISSLITGLIVGLLSLAGMFALAAVVRARQASPSESTTAAVISLRQEDKIAQPLKLASSHPAAAPEVDMGRKFFNKNCAVCHGAGGSGGFGPDLRHLTLSDGEITKIIRNGKGDMPAFGGKASESQIRSLIAYIHTLRR